MPSAGVPSPPFSTARKMVNRLPLVRQHEGSLEEYALETGARETWRGVRSGLASIRCHALLGPGRQETAFLDTGVEPYIVTFG